MTVQSLAPVVPCPHCGRAQQVDAAILAELARYQASVRDHLEGARREESHAAQWEHITGTRGTSQAVNVIVGFVLMLGLPVGTTLAFVFAVKAGLLPKGAEPMAGIAAMGGVMVGLVAYLAWFYGGNRARRVTRMRAAIVACPNCGAPNAMRPGDVAQRCEHCQALLMPGEQAVAQGIRAAQLAFRHAQLIRYRREREGMLHLQGASASNLLPLLLLGPFVLMTGGAAVGITYEMAFGEEPFNPAVFLAWIMFVASAGATIGFLAWQYGWKQVWGKELAKLSSRLGGTSSPGTASFVQWLNTYWPGPYEVTDLMHGPRAYTLTCHAAGYPCVILFDTVAGSNRDSGKVHVLLAAVVPGLGDGTTDQVDVSSAAPGIQHLSSLGFAVKIQQAGLIGTASDRSVAKMRWHPSAAAELLGVVQGLVAIAQALRAAPGAPA